VSLPYQAVGTMRVHRPLSCPHSDGIASAGSAPAFSGATAGADFGPAPFVHGQRCENHVHADDAAGIEAGGEGVCRHADRQRP